MNFNYKERIGRLTDINPIGLYNLLIFFFIYEKSNY